MIFSPMPAERAATMAVGNGGCGSRPIQSRCDEDAMTYLTDFSPDLVRLLPATHALLLASSLVVHPAVERVTLEGSRGLGGHPRPDSDVDLSLVVDSSALPTEEPAREALLRAVLVTTLECWRGPVECDLAAIYDQRGCGLRCFASERHQAPECPTGGTCHFGIYKIQRGMNGYVPWHIIRMELLYPLLEIWRRR